MTTLEETLPNGVIEIITYNDDGSVHDIAYSGITGEPYTSYDIVYGANALPASTTYSDGTTRTWTYNSDGSVKTITYGGIQGQAYTSFTITFGEDGLPASSTYSDGTTRSWTYNSDGSIKTITYGGIQGQAYTSFTVTFGTDGVAVSKAFSNGETEAFTYNSDGSVKTVTYGGIQGQAYTSYTMTLGAGGLPVSATYSNGVTKAWTYNGDGSINTITYGGIQGQAYTSYTITYGANDLPASATYSNGVTEAWTYNSDGSIKSITYGGVQGLAYTSYTITYGANGLPASATYSNGATEAWTYNSDGSIKTITYGGITGQAYTSDTVTFGANGVLLSKAFSNGQTQAWTYNNDGSVKTITYGGIQGQAYTGYTVTYGANGLPASATYSNGETEAWTYNSDGSTKTITYGGITGQAYTSYTITFGANGVAVSKVYSNGLTEAWTYNSDGSVKTVTYGGVQGQAYTGYTVTYGSNGLPASAIYSNGLTETWTYGSGGSVEIVQNNIPGETWNTVDTKYGGNGEPTQQILSFDGFLVRETTFNPDGSVKSVVNGSKPDVTLALTHDTGASATDTITSNAQITGTGSAGAVVSFTVDGKAISTTVTADDKGNWSFTPTGLSDGVHKITASEIDPIGTTTTSLGFTLDTTAPAMTAALVIPGTGADNETSSTSMTGSGDAKAIVHFTVDGVAISSTVVADADGNWFFAPDITTDGAHTVVASETDTAGNTGSASLTFTLAPRGPTLETKATAAVEGSPTSLYLRDELTNAGDSLASLLVSDIPVGAVLSDGTNSFTATKGAQSVDIATWSLTSLTIMPPDSANFVLGLSATEKDPSGDVSAASTSSLAVSVVPEAPAITADAVSGAQGSPIALNLGVSAAGLAGDSNSLSAVTIGSIPVGATISDGTHSFTAISGSTSVDVTKWSLSSLTITPTAAGNFTLTIGATEKDSSGDSSAPATVKQPVTVAAGFSLNTISPISGSNQGTVTMTLNGADFDANSQVEVVGSDGTVYKAAQIQLVNSGQLWASFDLTGVPTGDYGVEVVDNGKTASLSNAFTVNNGAVGAVSVSISTPESVQVGQTGTFTVTYTNTGQTDVVAPLIDITSPGALITGGTQDGTGGSSLEFLGTSSSGPAGILAPGASNTVTFSFTPTSLVGGGSFDIGAGTVQSGQTIDWSSLEASLKPANIDAADWNNVWNAFVTRVGTTTTSLQDALASEATELSKVGASTNDVNVLLQDELLQSGGGLQLSSLTGAADITGGTGMASLSLARIYQGTLTTRQAPGLFGNGWVSTYDLSAVTDSSGNVTIATPGGVHVFTLNSDGSYAAGQGDTDTLTKTSGGGYSLSDVSGTVTQFSANGLWSSITDAKGNAITAQWGTEQASGPQPIVVEEGVTPEPNTVNVLQSVTSSDGETLTFTSNGEGRITSATDSNGQTVTYSYDDSGEYLQSVTTATGTTDYGYVAPTIASTTGSGTIAEGLAFGTTSQAVTNPLQADALNEITNPDGTHEYFQYDDQGRLTAQYSDNNSNKITYAYVGDNEVIETDALGNTTTLYYNANGQIAEALDANGDLVSLNHDSNGNLVSAIGPTSGATDYTYDADGNLTGYKDANGNTVKATYAPGTHELTSFTDQNGDLTLYSYDSKGDLTSITYDNGSGDSYKYNSSGELTKSTDERGQTTSYTYNAAGQVTGEAFSDGTSQSYTYNSAGELTSATAVDGGVTSYGYNAAGELTSVTDANGRVETYSYNGSGQETQRVEPDGSTVNYSYNANNQLSQLTDGKGNLIESYSYNTAGELTGETMGNGATTAYSYDSSGNVSSITTKDNTGATTSYMQYSYNSDGRPTAVASQDGTWSYSYDADGELTRAMFLSTNASIANQDLTYTYDAAGNRTGTIFNGAVNDYTTNGLNQYTSSNGTTYSYDADGNLIAMVAGGKTTTYSYNSQNQLMSVVGPDGTTAYTYDALGNRVSQTVNGVTSTYVIDPLAIDTSATGPLASIAQVYNASGNVTATYDYGNGLAAEITGGTTDYYNTDAVGNVTSLSGASGNLVDTYDYTPFGTTLASTGSLANQFQFSGALGVTTDADGLVYMRARYYDPVTGRFDSTDPLNIKGGINLYDYVGSAPTLAVDPQGEFLILIIPVVGGLIGGIADAYNAKDGESVGGAFLQGFASGFVGTAVGVGVGLIPGVGPILAGAIGSGVANIIDQEIDAYNHNTNFDWGQLGLAVGTGGIGGGLFPTVGRLPNVFTPRGLSGLGANSIREINQTISGGGLQGVGQKIINILTPPPPPPPPIPPGKTAGASGDPHFTTYDGTHFDFQAIGEFIAAKSTVAGDTFEAQVRLESGSAKDAPGVTYITQVAIQVGTDRVTFGTPESYDSSRASFMMVDGKSVSMTGSTLTLSGGTVTEISSDQYEVVLNTGEVCLVGSNSLQITIPNTFAAGAVQGIFGSDEGTAKDFQLPDGTVLNSITDQELYTTYANAWRVTDTNSLFDYGAGETTATYTDTQYPRQTLTLSDLPASVVSNAEAAANAAGITDPTLAADAAYDYILSGNASILTTDAAADQGITVTNTPVITAPIVTTPSLGIVPNTPRIVETDGTTAVTFTVLLTGAVTTDTTVNYEVTGAAAFSTDTAGKTFFSASDFGGTMPSGSVTIAAGQTTATVTIDVPNAALGKTPDKWLAIAIATPGSNPIYNSTAQVDVVNNSPVPGIAAQPQLELLAGGGAVISGNGAKLTHTGNAYTLDLGQVLSGETLPELQVALANTAAAGADDLAALLASSTGSGFTLTGSQPTSTIAAGNSFSDIYLQPDTSKTGAQSQTLTFLAEDVNGTGYTGVLPTITLTIEDTVVAAAAGEASTSTISLGNVRVGASDSETVGISNTATTGAAGLDANATVTGGAVVSGSVSNLAAGSSDTTDLTVGINTSTAGLIKGTATVNFASDLGNTVAIPLGTNQPISVSGTVYREGQGAIALQTAVVHVGDTGVSNLVISNAAAADGYSEGLRTLLVSSSGALSANGKSTGLIAAGGSDSTSFTTSFSTAKAGVLTGSVTVDYVSDGTGTSGLGLLDEGDTVVPLSVAVDNYAQAAFSDTNGEGTLSSKGDNAYTLDLGLVGQGAGDPVVDLSVLNTASGQADLLAGKFSVSGDSAFSNSGLGDFNDIAAGSGNNAPTVQLSTTKAGTFSETITLDPTGYNSSGYSGALAPETLTITGTVISAASVTSVTATPSTGDLGPDKTVTFDVTLNQAVALAGVTADSTPYLLLSNGAKALYTSGSGSNTLVFTYTVGAIGSGEDASSLGIAGFAPNGAVLGVVGSTVETVDMSGADSFTSGPQIDTTAPQITLRDPGAVTNQASQTINGTIDFADKGETITLKDGNTVIGTVTADEVGQWSKTFTLNGEGTHDITASATDGAGNTGTASATYVLDTTSPLLTAGLADDTGSSATDMITNDPLLAGTGITDSEITVSVDGQERDFEAFVDGAGKWQLNPAILTDGAHSIVVTETDPLGNTATQSLSFTLDTTAPVVTAALKTNTSGSATTHDTTDDTLVGTGDANAVVEFIIDGVTSSKTVTADSTGAWSFAPTGLALGAHTIEAVETDLAGNTGNASVSFTLESATPPVTVALVSDTGASATDGVTSDDSLSGKADPNSVMTLTIDGKAVAATITANSSGIWTYTPTGLADRSHTVDVSGTNDAGGTGTASLSFTLETQAPPIAFTSGGGFITELAQTVSGTASDVPVGATVTVFDGKTPIGTGTVKADGTWTADITLITGADVTAQVSDLAGVVGTASPISYSIQKFTIEWGVDSNGDWTTAADWNTGKLPSAQDDALISEPVTVTVSTGSVSADQLATTDAATLTIDGGTLTLLGANSALEGQTNLTSGGLDLEGATTVTNLTFSNGTLTADAATAIGTLDMGGGVLIANSDVTVSTAMTWTGGALAGPGKVTVSGDATLALGTENYDYIRLETELDVAVAAILQSGSFYIGDYQAPSGTYVGGSLVIDAAGSLTIESQASILNASYYQSTAPVAMSNAGSILKTGTGTSYISVPLTNTGTIDVTGGTLVIGAGVSSALTGIEIAAGATLEINGGIDSLTGSGGYVGLFDLAGGILDTDAGNLTLSSAMAWSGGDIEGSGKILLTKTSTLALTSNQFLGTELDLSGAATLTSDAFYLGAYNPTSESYFAGTLDITSTGSLTMDDQSELNNYGTSSGVVDNAGTIMAAGSGTAYIEVSVANTGIIDVESGVLDLTDGGSSDLSGFQIASGATLIVSEGTFNLTGSGSYSGLFDMNSATIDTDGGDLTLSSAVEWDYGTIIGSGKVVLTKTSTLALTSDQFLGTEFDLSGAATMNNDQFYIGAYSSSLGAYVTGTLDITSTGTLTMNAGTGISTQGSVGNLIDNAGTITVAGSGSTYIGVQLVNTGTIDVTNGTLELTGGGSSALTAFKIASGSALELGGGTFSLTGTGDYSGLFALTGGILDTDAGDLTFTSAVAWSGSSAVGSGKLIFAKTSTLALSSDQLLGTELDLSGVATMTSDALYLDAYDPTTSAYVGGTLDILSGGSLAMDDQSAINNYGASLGVLTNAGTITASGTGIAYIYVNLTNSGMVDATSGSLYFGGTVTNSGTVEAADGNLTFNGALINTGEVSIGGGTLELNDGGSSALSGFEIASGATLDFNGGTFDLTGGGTYAGLFDLTGGTLDTDGGDLTLSSAVAWSGSNVFGSGKLILTKTSTLALTSNQFLGTELDLSGAATMSNDTLYLGAYDPTAGAYQAGTLNITSTGSLSMDDQGSISNYGADSGAVINAGTITASGAGTAAFYADVTNSGTIDATSGALYLGDAVTNSGTIEAADGNLTINGTLTNTGKISIDGGTLQLNSGGSSALSGFEVASGATLDFNGGTFDLTGGGSYAGLLDLTGGTLDTDGGDLTLSSAVAWSGSSVLGSGKLVLTKTSTLALTSNQFLGTELDLSGAATMTNDTVYLGAYDSTAGVYEGGTLNITSTGSLSMDDQGSVTDYNASGASVINAGTITAAGAGTAYLYTDVTNSGTIDATSGALYFNDTVTNSGTIEVADGNLTINGILTNTGKISVSGGTLQLNNGGSSALSGFEVASGATLDFNGGTFSLTGSGSYDGLFDLSGGTFDTHAGNMTLAGAVAWSGGSILGLGKLILAKASTLALTSQQFLGTELELSGEATMSDDTLYLGAYDSTTAAYIAGILDITSTGSLSMDDQGSINDYGTSSSSVSNAGTITAAGSGTAYLYSDVTNSGTIDATSGALYFNDTVTNSGTIEVADGDLTINGTLTNTGKISVSGGTLKLNNGGSSALSGFDIASGATLDLASGAFSFTGSGSYAGLLAVYGGTLDTDGGDLTLSGAMAWSGSSIFGSGKLILTKTSTLDLTSYQFLGTELELSGAATMSNDTLYLGAVDSTTGTYVPGSLDITSTGSLSMDDQGSITDYGTTGESVTNAGTITASGAGTADINSDVTNSGTIDATSGALSFGDTVTNSGTIEAADGNITFNGALTNTGTISVTGGILQLDAGGSSALSGFEVASGATLDLASGTFNMTGSGSYSGLFELTSGILDTDAGNLTLSSAMAWSGGNIVGSGKVVLANTATLALTFEQFLGTELDLSGAATMTSDVLYLGAYNTATSAYNAGTLDITSTGSLTMDDKGGINNEGTSDGAVLNAGTITKTGTGETGFDVNVTNTGTIAISAGTLDFDTTLSGTGSITIGDGAEAFFEGAAVSGTQAVDFTGDGGTLFLGTPSELSGFAIKDFLGTDALDLEWFTSPGATIHFTEDSSGTFGTLDIDNGSQTAAIKLFGQYTAAEFTSNALGGGGTQIMLTTAAQTMLAASHHA